MSGDDHDRDSSRRLIGFQCLRRLPPRHPWQPDVHEDEVWRGGLNVLERRFSVRCRDDAKTFELQTRAVDLNRVCIILDEQNEWGLGCAQIPP